MNAYTVVSIASLQNGSTTEIIRLSAMEIRGGSVKGTFDLCLKPTVLPDEERLALFGISAADFRYLPDRFNVLRRFAEFVQDSILVGYRLRGMLPLLKEECAKAGCSLSDGPLRYYDLNGYIEAQSLRCLCRALKVVTMSLHDTPYECRMIFDCFRAVCQSDPGFLERGLITE